MPTIFKKNRARYVRSITNAILQFNTNFDFADALGHIEPITTIHDLQTFTILEPIKKDSWFKFPEMIAVFLPLQTSRRIIAQVELTYKHQSDEIPGKLEITVCGEDFSDIGNKLAIILSNLGYADEIVVTVKGEHKFAK